MPAYNAVPLLPRTLAPLLAMRADGKVSEVIVVDDRSTDETAVMAEEMGARVLVTPVNGGPGAARNIGVKEAIGNVVWFVDSDVIAEKDASDHVAAAFADPQVGAVFGSYDDSPADPHWFSRYKNLMHHFYHQQSRGEPRTFWAGCGAIRKDVFEEVGGFDIEAYPYPSIEDIELGYRIADAGYRIRIDPEMQGKHLKAWRFRNAIFTDIFRRALPWSRLMISREGLNDDLNTAWSERVKAGVAGLLLLSLLAIPFRPAVWPVTLALFALASILNWRFLRFLYARGGIGLAIPALMYHQLYYVYSASAFVYCLLERAFLGTRKA